MNMVKCYLFRYTYLARLTKYKPIRRLQQILLLGEHLSQKTYFNSLKVP